jgi:hypothetical protein
MRAVRAPSIRTPRSSLNRVHPTARLSLGVGNTKSTPGSTDIGAGDETQQTWPWESVPMTQTWCLQRIVLKMADNLPSAVDKEANNCMGEDPCIRATIASEPRPQIVPKPSTTFSGVQCLAAHGRRGRTDNTHLGMLVKHATRSSCNAGITAQPEKKG